MKILSWIKPKAKVNNLGLVCIKPKPSLDPEQGQVQFKFIFNSGK